MLRCEACKRRKPHLCWECAWERGEGVVHDLASLMECTSTAVSRINWLKGWFDDLDAHLHDLSHQLSRIEGQTKCSSETPSGRWSGLEPGVGPLVEAGSNGHGATSGP